MDLIIAIKDETAYICNPPVKENHQEIMDRLEAENAGNVEEVLSFKRGDTVIDDSDNKHVINDIKVSTYMPAGLWKITDTEGNTIPVFRVKGTIIKEVPKYHIDGLLS